MIKSIVSILAAVVLPICVSNAWAADPIKQERKVEPFTSIELDGGYQVYISKGQECSLTLEGDPAILKDIKTEVKKKCLVIEPQEWMRLFKNDKVTVYITLKEIADLDINGSASVECSGAFESEELDLDIHGAGSVTMQVSAKEVDCDISGSGDVTLRGRVDDMNIDIGGSGSIKAFELEAKFVSVDIAGFGEVQLTVSQKLDGSIMGSGDIVYKGEPVTVHSDIIGAGRISKLWE